MKFVLIAKGRGSGCDYTIACNKDFKVFEANSVEDAAKVARAYWEDHGGYCGEPGIEELTLFVADREVPLAVDGWEEEEDVASRARAIAAEKERLRSRLAELGGGDPTAG